MVNPVSELKVIANKFGAVLEVSFILPAELPSNWKFYLFKKSKVDITQAEIDNYFNSINDLTAFNYNGMYVWDTIDPDTLLLEGQNIISDYVVISQETYYYQCVIRNEDSSEISAVKKANGIPEAALKVDIVDGKDIVAKAVEKMFDSLVNEKGQKVRLSRDVKIIKNFAIEPVSDPEYVMVERVNGSTYQRFFGQQYASHNNSLVRGDYDSDVIRVTYMTANGNIRRDSVANIFRAYKQFLLRYIIASSEYQVKDVNISIEGDYQNPQFHGVNHIGLNVIFSLIVENLTTITDDLINQHITNMVVET